MKQNKTVLTISSILTAALLLSACGAKPATESAAPSSDPSPIVVNPTPSAEAKQYPLIVQAGNAVLADLNGDGKQDEVYFEAYGEETAIRYLSVNGTDYVDSIYSNQEIYLDNPEPAYYCITDIDTSDKMLEIAIMDWGPSDDYTTNFFRYNGTELKYIGYVCGMIVSSFDDMFDKSFDLTFDGDGTVGSYFRLRVLQTWWADVDWKLSDTGGFEVVPQDLYYPKHEYGDVTLLTDISVYDDRCAESGKTVLSKGTVLGFLATDNKEWVLAETSDGKECWVHLDAEYGQMVETTDGYKYSSEVFSGLCIAD